MWPSPGPGPAHPAAVSPTDLTVPCALAWPNREKIARLENQGHFPGERPPACYFQLRGWLRARPQAAPGPGQPILRLAPAALAFPRRQLEALRLGRNPGPDLSSVTFPALGWLRVISPVATTTPPSVGPCALTSFQPQGVHHPPFPARLPQVGACGGLHWQGLHLPPHWDASGRQ